jgi:hypothetical protein
MIHPHDPGDIVGDRFQTLSINFPLHVNFGDYGRSVINV